MKPHTFGHWSPVIATIIRWNPVAIAGDRGRGGPVKVNGDCWNPYLILAPTGTPRETLSISICQWPLAATGGRQWLFQRRVYYSHYSSPTFSHFSRNGVVLDERHGNLKLHGRILRGVTAEYLEKEREKWETEIVAA
ncbi:hypothetical protein B0H11DRAFT_1941571 [Mycena galericulata]|nr:hypothetical protein B0H11DRAFT_1941571 [Mycena galericulata]